MKTTATAIAALLLLASGSFAAPVPQDNNNNNNKSSTAASKVDVTTTTTTTAAAATTSTTTTTTTAAANTNTNIKTITKAKTNSSSPATQPKPSAAATKHDFSAMDNCIPSRLHFYPETYDFAKLFREDQGNLVVALLGQLSAVRDTEGRIVERKVFPTKVVFECLAQGTVETFFRLVALFEADFRKAVEGDGDACYAALSQRKSAEEVLSLAEYLITRMGWKPTSRQYAGLISLFHGHPSRQLYDFVEATHQGPGIKFDSIVPGERYHLGLLMAAMVPASEIKTVLLPILMGPLGCESDILFLNSEASVSKSVVAAAAAKDSLMEEALKRVLERIPEGSRYCMDGMARNRY